MSAGTEEDPRWDGMGCRVRADGGLHGPEKPERSAGGKEK